MRQQSAFVPLELAVTGTETLSRPLRPKQFDTLPDAPAETEPRLETEMMTMPDTERGLLNTEGNQLIMPDQEPPQTTEDGSTPQNDKKIPVPEKRTRKRLRVNLSNIELSKKRAPLTPAEEVNFRMNQNRRRKI